MKINYEAIATEAGLSHAALSALINEEILVLRAFPLVSEDRCQQWATMLKESPHFSRYTNAQEVRISKLGMTLFETQGDAGLLKQYFRWGEEMDQLLTETFFPLPDPLTILQQMLWLAWPAGLRQGEIGPQKMCPGLIRKVENGNQEGLPPHQDHVGLDVPGNEMQHRIQTQLAVNLYLQVPAKGGELEIWDLQPDAETVKSWYTGRHDFIDRSLLPEPTVIRPRVGELILFRSDCIHAVSGTDGSDRIAAGCFLGMEAATKPLWYWA